MIINYSLIELINNTKEQYYNKYTNDDIFSFAIAYIF